MLTIILFFVGFIILVKGADILIQGASSLANYLKVSKWLIGIIIVGIGTSIPEFGITLFSSLSGQAEIGIGTIIGSNSLNILFILGLSALLVPLQMTRQQALLDLSFNLISVVLAFFLALVTLQPGMLSIGRFEGIVLVSVFLYWVVYIIRRRAPGAPEAQEENKTVAIPISILLVLFGIASVILGSEWVVDGGIEIARYFNASEGLIGLTIVGIGTSLPELTVSVRAALKRNFAISIGNIVGSNIFDFLFILGFAAIIQPLRFPYYFAIDFLFTILASVMLVAVMLKGRAYRMERWQGGLFICTYLAYLTYLLYRG